MKHIYDVIIIGGGPAGLNAALMLARCCKTILVCDHGHPRNAAAKNMHGYLSRDGINPRKLLQLGRAEVEKYGVHFRETEIVKAKALKSGFSMQSHDRKRFKCKKLLIATGVRDELPRIEGIADLYGSSVHHCPYCDGWEYRGKRLAALGDARDALGLALLLRNWSDDVAVLTNGEKHRLRRYREVMEKNNITVVETKIDRLEGNRGKLRDVIFEDGKTLRRDGLFFNTGQRQKSHLAEMLGCEFHRNGGVVVDKHQRTCVPGLYVCGDALREVQFVVCAAADGAIAAAAINKEFQEEAGRTL